MDFSLFYFWKSIILCVYMDKPIHRIGSLHVFNKSPDLSPLTPLFLPRVQSEHFQFGIGDVFIRELWKRRERLFDPVSQSGVLGVV